ncbi:hypothetical protein [Rhodohalobacter halophilus]|uniref:hypothetical protein n=1 Tax=Rhodohalobacter halophilus TaxID=1812810 RepID=UPI00114D26DB|nr:hypothetical protein [Rhodohalobacter halophilus]
MNEQNERKKLELMINRAADGELTEQEISTLNQQLQGYPDLLENYHDILALPDLKSAYDRINIHPSDYQTKIDRLISRMEEDGLKNFAEASIFWFKRYAFAASVAALALVSGFYLITDNTGDNEMAVEQLLYPDDGGDAETYVLYLNEYFD